MAQLMQAFNPHQFDPTQGIGGLPLGKYPVVIESSEVKPNKNNDGGFLQFGLKIIDGPSAGITGAYRLNLYNTSAKAVEIAHRQLSAVCHVVNVFKLGNDGTDVSVLHNIPFIIEVGPQKDSPEYTEVKKVFDINGNEPNKGGAAAPAQPAQQQAPAQQFQQQQAAPAQQFQQQQQPPAQQAQAAWGQPQAQQPAQQPQGGAPAAWGQAPAQAAQQQQPQAQQQWGQQQPAQGGAPAPWGQK